MAVIGGRFAASFSDCSVREIHPTVRHVSRGFFRNREKVVKST